MGLTKKGCEKAKQGRQRKSKRIEEVKENGQQFCFFLPALSYLRQSFRIGGRGKAAGMDRDCEAQVVHRRDSAKAHSYADAS
jgi:hypothetical protein